ncbi:hypothetical protein AURDEDRAFT_161007 [Auricularia subglabra TFB-10046 SS5]|nr:hypothetical protein AURDEDRAFT_161007 [Auricularia subglabra TFB-10046 SS5]
MPDAEPWRNTALRLAADADVVPLCDSALCVHGHQHLEVAPAEAWRFARSVDPASRTVSCGPIPDGLALLLDVVLAALWRSFARAPDALLALVLDVSFARKPPLDEPFARELDGSFPRLLDVSFARAGTTWSRANRRWTRCSPSLDVSFVRAPDAPLANVLDVPVERKPPLDEPFAPLLDKWLVIVLDSAPNPLRVLHQLFDLMLNEPLDSMLHQPRLDASFAPAAHGSFAPVLGEPLRPVVLLLDASVARVLDDWFARVLDESLGSVVPLLAMLFAPVLDASFASLLHGSFAPALDEPFGHGVPLLVVLFARVVNASFAPVLDSSRVPALPLLQDPFARVLDELVAPVHDDALVPLLDTSLEPVVE